MKREKLQPCQRKRTAYEWDLEEFDSYGDVVNHHHSDSLLEIGAPDFNRSRYALVLVRDSGSEADGLQDRQWAYTEPHNGQLILPLEFDGGAKIPVRFNRELRDWQNEDK
jgi:hypothetical protein